eukprot:357392-Chlamydomonas_euryale.AAC.2
MERIGFCTRAHAWTHVQPSAVMVLCLAPRPRMSWARGRAPDLESLRARRGGVCGNTFAAGPPALARHIKIHLMSPASVSARIKGYKGAGPLHEMASIYTHSGTNTDVDTPCIHSN